MTDEEKADCGLLSELFPEDDAMTPPSEELKVALPEPAMYAIEYYGRLLAGELYETEQTALLVVVERNASYSPDGNRKVVPMFTAAQVLQAVEAEREKLYALAKSKGWGMKNDDPFEDYLRDLWAEMDRPIRRGK